MTDPTCPHCGTKLSEHEADHCLNHWADTVIPDNRMTYVPDYSGNPAAALWLWNKLTCTRSLLWRGGSVEAMLPNNLFVGRVDELAAIVTRACIAELSIAAMTKEKDGG